jgi:hypothetical protein
MRKVAWEDNRGKRHASLVRDTDHDSMAPKGVRLDPPDIEQIDWEAVKRDLHNALIDQGLITQQDVSRQQTGITSAILGAMRRRVILLYRPIINE